MAVEDMSADTIGTQPFGHKTTLIKKAEDNFRSIIIIGHRNNI